MGFCDYVAKLTEHDISDPEIFFGLTEDEIIGFLELKTEGKKQTFKKKFQKVKDEHEKKKAEAEA